MFFQKTFLFVLCFLWTLSTLSAAVITWTGAGPNNLWSNSANWDTGTIPGTLDDVVIPLGAGTVRFNYPDRQVQTIYVSIGTSLSIMNGTTLRLLDTVTVAINNHGALTIRSTGTLEINNALSVGINNWGNLHNHGLISMANHGGNALLNNGSVYNKVTGVMEFLDAGSENIFSTDGRLINNGKITFLSNGTGGMLTGNDFENSSSGLISFEDGHAGRLYVSDTLGLNNGQIRFVNSTSIGPVFLGIGSYFTNGSTGLISVDGFLSTGVVISSGGTFDNYGELYVANPDTSGTGLSVNGTLVNNKDAFVRLFFLYHAMYISTVGRCQNRGFFYGEGSEIEILNYGLTVNLDDGEMDFYGGNVGLHNSVGGTFTNKKSKVYFTSLGSHDIKNFGTITNKSCGHIYFDQAIFNQNGLFENYGWLHCYSPGTNHISTFPQILNEGFIEDPYDRFVVAIDNQETLIPSLVNPQANVPYPDALDVNNVTLTDITDFYLDSGLSIFAGTYDYTTNVYTPNNAAIGATILYAGSETERCSDFIRIFIDGSIAPIAGNPEEALLPHTQAGQNSPKQKLFNFPNPTTGLFQTQLPRFAAGSYDLQVLNAQGQIIASQQGDATVGDRPTFDLSEYPAGMYWTRLLVDGDLIAQEKIIRLK